MHYLDFASDLRNAVLSKAFVFVFYQAFVVGNGCPRLLPTWCWCSTPKAQEVSNTLIRLEAYFSTAKTLNWSCGWKRAHKLSNACWNSWPGHICMHLFFFACYFKVVDWATPCWGRNRKDERGHHEGGRPLEMIFMLTIGMMFFGARFDKIFGERAPISKFLRPMRSQRRMSQNCRDCRMICSHRKNSSSAASASTRPASLLENRVLQCLATSFKNSCLSVQTSVQTSVAFQVFSAT
jgi:hypothetical protein